MDDPVRRKPIQRAKEAPLTFSSASGILEENLLRLTQVIEPDPFLLHGMGPKVGMTVRQQSTAPHHQIGLNLWCSAVRLFLALNGHAGSHKICPLLKVNRTCHRAIVTAHVDPYET